MSSPSGSPPPTSSSAINDDKLSGQLIIKAQLGDDIRKMMIHNEDLTLNELVLMMERVFVGKISNSDELTIKYLDEDGDQITLLNDGDLTVALHFHKLLRLFVSVNGNEPVKNKAEENDREEGEDLIDAKLFGNELQEIRNSVQKILDRLQLSPSEVPLETPTVVMSSHVSNTTRELDSHKQVVQQQPRVATPDSIQSNSNHSMNNEKQSVSTQQEESANVNQVPPSIFQQTQMPTPHFAPMVFNNDQQAKTNVFGPPPTTNLPGMPPLPNNTVGRYTPATTPNSSAPPSSFGQQGPPTGHQSGFYAQQQAAFPAKPPMPGYNAFVPQPAPTSHSSNAYAATINPSFAQQPPPPMASQQAYGAYPPQNAYYNQPQQYPRT